MILRKLRLEKFICIATIIASVLCLLSYRISAITTKLDVQTSNESIFLQHIHINFSDPVLDNKYVSDSTFDPRGMEHISFITRKLLDFILRHDAVPSGVNVTQILVDPRLENVLQFFCDNWQEIVLQYIGVSTLWIFWILAAVIIPLTGLCVCCGRCLKRCEGRTSQSYDEKGDSCKRWFYAVILSILVITAMLGVVCTFVTNRYWYEGTMKEPERLHDATSDVILYLRNTRKEFNGLMIDNYGELKDTLFDMIDQSGDYVKTKISEFTEAVAVEDLFKIVSSLVEYKRYLKDINKRANIIKDKVLQLQEGLPVSRKRLVQAFEQCSAVQVCSSFLKENKVKELLELSDSFRHLPSNLKNMNDLMKDISNIIDNDVEKKIKQGKKQFDDIKIIIDNSLVSIRPSLKRQISEFGQRLKDQSDKLDQFVDGLIDHIFNSQTSFKEHELLPQINHVLNYVYYGGISIGAMLLSILLCHILGLFYGFCGKRPGNVYNDDCCNTSLGASWLLAGVYMTFFCSLLLLVVTSVQIVIGSTVDKVICDAVKYPNQHPLIFEILDKELLRPTLMNGVAIGSGEDSVIENGIDIKLFSQTVSSAEIIQACHSNLTLYNWIGLEGALQGGPLSLIRLRNWRNEFGIQKAIDDFKRSSFNVELLKNIEILPPQARKFLKQLADSDVSDLNFQAYTSILHKQVTKIDLSTFTRRLSVLEDKLKKTSAGAAIAPTLRNEALFLQQMQSVVEEIKLNLRSIENSANSLKETTFLGHASLGQALKKLIKQATKAEHVLRREGPELLQDITHRYVGETLTLVDSFIERVIDRTHNHIGFCGPLSKSYNASLIMGICLSTVNPFNSVWVSTGVCIIIYIIGIPLALTLVSLHQKMEPYPGRPLLMDSRQPTRVAKKSRSKHRRQPSEYLPDASTHSRAAYRNANTDSPVTLPLESRMSHIGSTHPPPLYSRVEAHVASTAPLSSEYERPPPYYYPGPSKKSS